MTLFQKLAKIGKKGFWPITILNGEPMTFEKALMPKLESELATSKFQGHFKRQPWTHHWSRVLNYILVVSEMGSKPVPMASVDCAKIFATVYFSALLESLSDSVYHILLPKLTAN